MSRLCLALALACAAVLATAPSSSAGVANAGLPGASAANPLAGMTWGQYRIASRDPNGQDPVSAYFNTAASDADRATFDKILTQPRFRWFGAWNGSPRLAAQDYIDDVTHGNPNIGVQIAIFRLQPFEKAACTRLPTSSETADYKRWTSEYAAGIGSARVALLVQPDMPFTLCLPHRSKVDLNLISWTVAQFNALPHTTVYIDAGAGDWMKPGTMARMLKAAGARRARGFALNLTHFDSTAHEVAYGKKIVAALAKLGVRGKHFVVDTSKNGRPFTTQAHKRTFLRGTVCASSSSTACVTLGQPPTTNTGTAAADAFLWLGRPWVNNAARRSYDEVLQLVRTSPFF
jgi:endoglucanase